MNKALAIFRNGPLEFDEPMNWPIGTKLEVRTDESAAVRR